MITPFKDHYAFGFLVDERPGRQFVMHTGGMNGFSSEADYFIDNHVTVVALSNVEGAGATRIAGPLKTLAHGGKVKLPIDK